jgi:multimeric flavodoxin WrbA
MNVLILDGGPRDGRGETCRSISESVAGGARQRGWAVTALELDRMAIKPCRGCFACWLKHPGVCAIKDDEESVHKAMAGSDVQVWITPVTFGGYSPALKKALDRSIPNILPFFIKVRGEVHHPQRYAKRRSFLAFGTLASPDAEAERIFHNLVQRNALNLASVMTESRVLYEGEDGAGVADLVEGLLHAAEEAK